MRPGYNLFDALERATAIGPDAVAVRCGATTSSFAELRERVVRLGNAWRAQGLGRGDRIAVLSDNCHRFAEVYWAAAYLGAIVVPLESRLGDDEIGAVIDAAAPAALYAGDAGHLARLRRLVPQMATDAICGEAGTGATDFDGFVAAGDPVAVEEHVAPDDPVALFFTAAVEGRPRGAVVTHRNLLAQAQQTADGIDLGPADVQGLFLPLSHTFGGYLLFVAGCRGVATTLLATFDASEAARLIGAGLVTWFAGFAPMAARVADAAEAAGVALGGRLRLIIGLDAPAVIERYLDLGVAWWNFYGQTETAGLVAMGEVVARPAVSEFVGRPLAQSRVSIRDQEGRAVPAGEAGEAWVRSDVVVERYWPDESTRLTDDGWLRTGDVLRAGPRSELWFVGRTTDKDLIKPGGLNVYPAEVETVLLTHAGVARAWVFGLPDPEWRERVCAVVVPPASAVPPTEEELKAHCRARAAAFKCPQRVLVVTEGPELLQLTRLEARERYAGALGHHTGPEPSSG